MNNRIKCILFLSCFLSLNSSLVTFKDLQEQTKHFKNLSHYEMSTLLAKTRNYIFEKSKNENQSIKKDDNEKSKETLYKEPFDDDELLFPDRKLLSDDEKNLHENFLQRYLKDTKDEKNEYVRYFFYNIDRLINTFRLKHIIKLTSTSDYWQVPETWIRKSSQENELKLVSEKIEVRENDLVFNLNSIQAFVLLAFSTGFTDLHRANTLYDFKAKKYSFVDVEELLLTSSKALIHEIFTKKQKDEVVQTQG